MVNNIIKKSKIIKQIYNDKLLDDFQILSRSLNNIFKNININITKSVIQTINIKPRTKKLTFEDVVCYYFNYLFINNTKLSVVSNYNYENNVHIHPSNYQKKEALIPLSFYQSLFFKIKQLFNTYKKDDKATIISVDGTYNNTNINNNGNLETALNMGYFDVTNQIPINIEYKGSEKKNKEINSFIEYINNHNCEVKQLIFVFDRAYFSYDFINFLDNKKINYVIRMKNNSLYLNQKNNNDINNINDDNNDNGKKKKKTKLKKQLVNANIRFITHKEEFETTKKDKNKKDVKFKRTIECNLVTNLNINDYKDSDIKKIYLSRWDVEVFFKFLKSNFKFSNLKEHTEKTVVQHKKKYFIILIQIYIAKLIEVIYEKNTKKLNNHTFNTKNKNKYVIKYNKSLMITGLKNIVNLIIKHKINKNDLYKYADHFMVSENIQTDISKERKCKNPSYKWYGLKLNNLLFNCQGAQRKFN
jgi:hypothetical protein